MATPLYNALKAKVRDWANRRSTATIPDSVVEDCLKYGAEDCYQHLRVPPLEENVEYVITADDNPANTDYSKIPLPLDFIEFIYVRRLPGSTGDPGIVYNEITDNRTFFDPYAEKYNRYHFAWKDDYLYIRPQLAVGDVLEFQYYKRLALLNATYSVVSANYIIGVADADQTFLELTGVLSDTPLYFSTSGGVEQVFDTYAEAAAYGPTVTTKYYVGREAANWLRDEKEQLLLWASLYHVGAYLFDQEMEATYARRTKDTIENLNREERYRRAKGGNVRINVNTNGMI